MISRLHPSSWPLPLRLLVLGGLYFAIVVAALLPNAQPSAEGGFDHYLHTIVFGGLTIVTFAAFPRLWTAASVVFVVSVLIEVGQLFVPERSASLSDVGANALGVSIAVAAILIWRAVFSRPTKLQTQSRSK